MFKLQKFRCPENVKKDAPFFPWVNKSMSFQGQPTAGGTYLVKQYNGNNYWKYVSDRTRWIQLDPLDKNSDLFKVHCFYPHSHLTACWFSYLSGTLSQSPLEPRTFSPSALHPTRVLASSSLRLLLTKASTGATDSLKDAWASPIIGDSGWALIKNTQSTVTLCVLHSSDFVLSIKVDGLDHVLDSRNNPERVSCSILRLSLKMSASPWHKCVHFYQDQDVSPCTQRSRYFLITIQADSQRFVFQLVGNPGSDRSKLNGEFPFLERRAIVPVKTARIGKHKAMALDGTPLPDLNNVQGDIYFMFPKVR